MNNRIIFFSFIAILGLTGFGCKKAPTTIEMTSSDIPPTISEEELLGSWHADPFVSSGYSDIYVFRPNDQFYFFSSEYTDATEDNPRFQSGTWSIQDNVVELISTQATVKYGDDPEPYAEIKKITLGSIESSSPDESAYETKRLFDETYFWNIGYGFYEEIAQYGQTRDLNQPRIANYLEKIPKGFLVEKSYYFKSIGEEAIPSTQIYPCEKPTIDQPEQRHCRTNLIFFVDPKAKSIQEYNKEVLANEQVRFATLKDGTSYAYTESFFSCPGTGAEACTRLQYVFQLDQQVLVAELNAWPFVGDDFTPLSSEILETIELYKSLLVR